MSDAYADARALLARLGVDVGDAPPERVAALLTECAARLDDRDARKLVRRALYRLSQRGVAVPERPAATPVARAILAPAIDGLVSAVDGRGDRLVWLVRDEPGGGVLLVAADVNEPAGLRDLRILEVTRKQLRTTRERLQAETGLRLVPADWRVLDALLVEAQDRLPDPVERKLDYRRARTRLTPDAPRSPRELASARVTAPTAAEVPVLLAASPALLTEPELRTWWPSPEAAAPFVVEIRAVRESPIVLSPVQQEERLREMLERAAPVLYPPAVVARRLDASAYVFAETGRIEAARQALAVAIALRAEPAKGAETPLVQALVHQGLGAYLAAMEAERREERQSALVLTPGEVTRARSPSRPPRAPG